MWSPCSWVISTKEISERYGQISVSEFNCLSCKSVLVLGFELEGGYTTGLFHCVGQDVPLGWGTEVQEVAGAVAFTDATGGIDAGDEFEGDLFGGEGFELEALTFCEGVKAWIAVLGGAEDVEALGNEGTIFPCERHDISDGSNRNEVEIVLMVV